MRAPDCCLLRKCLASPRQRFMYTALPRTTASYGARLATSPTGTQSTLRPESRKAAAIDSAISSVEPRFEAYATRTRVTTSTVEARSSSRIGALHARHNVGYVILENERRASAAASRANWR